MHVQKCPICEGRGEVADDFYADGSTKCRACSKGLIFLQSVPDNPVIYIPTVWTSGENNPPYEITSASTLPFVTRGWHY